jgi:ribonuclease P protein component
MLPQKRRIPRKEFDPIIKEGQKYNSPKLLLYFANNNKKSPDNQSRFAFSVSKKVAKLAVSRNKYRRMGYAVIEKHLSGIEPGSFLFFSFKKNSLPIKFPELEKEVVGLLYNSGVLK